MTSAVSGTSSSSSTVDGLVSGLNTTQLISQLMQVEAQPQQDLKNKVTAEQAVLTAYQGVNTNMLAIKTASDALTLNTGWQAAKATSSSTSVTATATGAAALGSVTFSVTKLAAAHVVTSQFASPDTVTTGSGIDITVGANDPVHIDFDPDGDSAQAVADAVNAANTGVKAQVLTTDQGTILQFSSTTTGGAGTFTIGGLSSPTQIATQGADAQLTVGNPLAGGYTMSSANGSFTGLMPGVTITANKLENGITVTVGNDGSAVADKMQAIVDAMNASLKTIATQTAYNATAKLGGPLTGDFTVSQLQQNLLSSVSNGSDTYGSFSGIGVQTASDGTITFDRAAFLSAYQADPAKTQDTVQNGFAKQMSAVANAATDPVTGTLTTSIQGGNSMITDLNTRVDDWTGRLADKQAALQSQFANLEVALGKMKDQSNWLSGQLSSLPGPAAGG